MQTGRKIRNNNNRPKFMAGWFRMDNGKKILLYSVVIIAIVIIGFYLESLL